MKKRILVCVLSALAIITTLALTAKRPQNLIDTINRVFLPNNIRQVAIKKTLFADYYISGFTNQKIVFGNYKVPYHLMILSHNLLDSQFVQIPRIDSTEKREPMLIKVDSPYFYISNIKRSTVSIGKIADWKIDTVIYIDDDILDVTAVSPNSFIYRSHDSIKGQDILTKRNLKTGSQYGSTVLERQIDGIFCVDGMVNFNRGLIVYLYYYRNQFVVTDTNLQIVAKGHTIDTVTRAKIRPAKIQHGTVFTMAEPPLIVNRRSVVSSGRLFVNSNIIGANEKGLPAKASTIDVYDINSNKYEFSFFIPSYEGKQMRAFYVNDGVVYALYGNAILMFEFDLKYGQTS